MTTFLIRRFLQSIAFILVSSLVIYTVLVILLPNGPYNLYQQMLTDPRVQDQMYPLTPDDLIQPYKLDKPWPVNYLAWLFDPSDTTQVNAKIQTVPKGIDIAIGNVHIKGSGMLTGDLGRSVSYARGRPVTELLGQRWGNTAMLMGLSLLLSVLVSLPIGVIAAVRHRSKLDHTMTFFSFAGLSVPSFVLGLLLIIGLSIFPKQLHDTLGLSWFPFLPAGGIYNANNGSWGDRLYHLVLPVLALSIPQIAGLSRYVRFSMLDVLRQDYVRTAWAKGLSMRRVVLKHAFRNALIPIITVIGLVLPGLASGAIVIESVFDYPGMGQLYYRSLGGCLATQSMLGTDPPPCPPLGYPPDYPLALTMTILLVIIVALANMLADVLYTAADPRVNYSSVHST